MARYLTAQQVVDVPADATVTDYEELSAEEQALVRDLVEGEFVSSQSGQPLDGELVRFGDCYRIRAAGHRAAD